LTGNVFNSAYTNNYAPAVMPTSSQPETAFPAPEVTSRLLVPYAGQLPVSVVRTTDFPTIHTGEDTGALVPAVPGEQQQVHVPPMYTKPRPIIPRYRVISGLISFFVMIGLLCGGSIYFAQVTGRLGFLEQLINPQFQNVHSTPVTPLPVPATPVVYASNNTIITSATTASRIDASGQPQFPTEQFFVNKPVYVTFSVHSQSGGVVTIDWYTDKQYFESSRPLTIQKVTNGTSISGNSAESFDRPAQGMVKLYWNHVLQVTLYFVIEPD
jgi:hypothetical protein